MRVTSPCKTSHNTQEKVDKGGRTFVKFFRLFPHLSFCLLHLFLACCLSFFGNHSKMKLLFVNSKMKLLFVNCRYEKRQYLLLLCSIFPHFFVPLSLFLFGFEVSCFFAWIHLSTSERMIHYNHKQTVKSGTRGITAKTFYCSGDLLICRIID